MSNQIQNKPLYSKIAELLHAARQNAVHAVNRTMVHTYYEIGRMIVEDEQQGRERAEYGKHVLKDLSKQLTADFGKGFSVQNLENMRKFYLLYGTDEKSQSMIRISEKPNTVLSWTHYLILIRELGKGFTFAGRQVRFTFDEKHFKVDLVFFNRLLRCFVLIDLKIGELTHQDIGQMQMYVNYYDRFVRLTNENKTAGIILCKDKNDTLVEITLPQDNDSIFASRYQTVLPDKQTFIALLNQDDVFSR